jgi:hypothetical protein
MWPNLSNSFAKLFCLSLVKNGIADKFLTLQWRDVGNGHDTRNWLATDLWQVIALACLLKSFIDYSKLKRTCH